MLPFAIRIVCIQITFLFIAFYIGKRHALCSILSLLYILCLDLTNFVREKKFPQKNIRGSIGKAACGQYFHSTYEHYCLTLNDIHFLNMIWQTNEVNKSMKIFHNFFHLHLSLQLFLFSLSLPHLLSFDVLKKLSYHLILFCKLNNNFECNLNHFEDESIFY